MVKNNNKLLAAIILSAVVAGSNALCAKADSLSFNDFSLVLQSALKENTVQADDDYNSSPNNDFTIYYKWITDGNGNKILTEGTSDDYEYLYNVTSSYGTGVLNKYYNVTSDANGNKILVNGTENDYDFVVNYDASQNSYYVPEGNNIEITGDFSGLTNIAIENYGTVSSVTSDFLDNVLNYSNKTGRGAAIYNFGNIGAISGVFINNYIDSPKNNAYGGAVNNIGNIGLSYNEGIKGAFIGNHALSTMNSARGGAIYNEGAITKIDGDFINNYTIANTSSYGGAIVNAEGTNSSIGIIDGNFINNYAHANTNDAIGGAIRNYSLIGTKDENGEINGGGINGNFIGNSAVSNERNVYGGAIHNIGTVYGVNGDFIKNSISAKGRASGGAIYNVVNGKIISLNSNFTGNTAQTLGITAAVGGAISNDAEIENIKGNFTGNYTFADQYTYGGAIYNGSGTITNIEGNFNENYAITNSGEAVAGAINNENIITNINGNFNGNYAKSKNGSTYGGAIFNIGSIEKITGNFSKNSIYGQETSYGGAIYNKSSRGSAGALTILNGDFINNSSVSTADAAYGGAIYNGGKITEFAGNVSDNYISGATSAYGGAIYNNGIISKLKNTSFTKNHAESQSGNALGGAIFSTTDLNIVADNGKSVFSGNYTDSAGIKEQNAIYINSSAADITLSALNNGQIIFDDTINGLNGYKLFVTGDESGIVQLNNLVNNASAELDTATLKIGVTDNTNNSSDVFKDSTLNVVSGVVDTTDSLYTNYNFKSLTSSKDARYSIDISLSAEEQLSDTFTLGEGSSGTIYLSSINVNNTCSDNEKYILNIINAKDDSIQLDYDNSKVLQWAAPVMTSDMILAKDFGLYTKNTTNDSIIIRGLLDSLAEWSELDTTEDKIFTFVDSSDRILSRDINELKGENITIKGANNIINIDNHKFLDLISDGQNVSISNVTIENSNDITNNGIFNLSSVTINNADVENNNELNISGSSKLTGDIKNNAQLTLTDAPKIEGVLTNKSDVKIDNADIIFTNEINGKGNIKISDSTIKLNNIVSNQTFSIDNSDITLDNVNTFTNNSLYMNSGNFNVSNLGMSSLSFDVLSLPDGNININSVDVDLANSTMGRIKANTYKDVSGTVNVNNLNLISSTNKASTDILFADKELAGAVSYNGSNEVAYSPIYKYDVTYNAKDDGGYFNFTRSLAGTGANSSNFNPAVMVSPVATQIGGFLSQAETLQQSFYHMNRYTKYTHSQRLAADSNNKYASIGKSVYSQNPLSETSKGIWYNPYTSFETVNLKGGIGVSNVTYGTLIGGDTDLYDIGHGYKGVISTFIGYNGSHQAYNGNSIYQNGGTLGVTGTLYKNNFFTGITASTGASTGSANTMYGTDNFTMLTAGIASKSGYNWELYDGKFIVQPTLYLGYTFVNTFDYTNAAGIKINSDPLHALQIIPGVTYIANLKSGWQPYVSVNMVFNAMDKTHFKANDISLPQLSVKPYVQYGAGVQKTWGEKYTAFAQSMVRNGGRNGISLSFGFRWMLGKKNNYHENVKTTEKKIIKQIKSSNFKA